MVRKTKYFPLVFVLLISLFNVYIYNTATLNSKYKSTYFYIEKGDSNVKIAKQLKDIGIVNELYSALLLVYLLNFNGNSIKAGEYILESNINLVKTLKQITKGSIIIHRVTIKEGTSVSEVVRLLYNIKGLRGEIKQIPEEGSLMPDTYFYCYGDKRQDLIKKMQDSMRKFLETHIDKRNKDCHITDKNDIVSLASIIEKETGVDAEKPKMASVFFNRLRKKMMLQSDPTVIYALTKGAKFTRRLTLKDLDTNSPYNTYRRRGIPKKAICNPSRKSILAVLNPIKTKYLFFVSKGDDNGEHMFARTWKEHLKNKDLYKKFRQEQQAVQAKQADQSDKQNQINKKVQIQL